MEFVVVAQSGLTRAGARLLTVLEKAHRAALLTPEQYDASEQPPRNVGVIYLGEFPTADDERVRITSKYHGHGVTFGHRDSRAFVHGRSVDDPVATLQALNREVGDLQEDTGVELLSVDTSDRAALRGVHLAGMYLDPYLPVPAETEVARKIDFSPTRMCWERQYTFGIARFLVDTFDEFAESLA